jgi:ABC-2 type transport system ATP-binding protein
MIEVSHIRKKYGKKQILTDISFTASPGECIAVVGRNGCGKSTLLKILAGVMDADGGEIVYYGKNTIRRRREFCGYLPQENPLMEELSVRDNLRLWEGKHRKAMETVIAQFGLSDILKQKVKTLSGGMKRRLSIACTLMKMPAVMIMDEPTTALDLYYKESIQVWMQQYLKGNGIVVMTTHDEGEIAQADRCLLMRDGVLSEVDKTEVRRALQ